MHQWSPGSSNSGNGTSCAVVIVSSSSTKELSHHPCLTSSRMISNACIFVHLAMGMSLVQTGEHARALFHCQKARELGASTIGLMSRACSIYAVAGQTQKAESLYEDLLAARESQYTRFIFLAHASAGLKRKQETLDWLNKAYEQRDPLLVFLKTDPRFEAFSDLPESSNLLQHIGLPGHSVDHNWGVSA
jgi:hypothetical protein